MKHNILSLAFTLGFSMFAFGQVGINNTAPKATLDITAKTTDGSKPEGVIAPRLTGDQIKDADAQYGSAQVGTIIYATSATNSPTTKTANITAPGYYYFDGTKWSGMGAQVTNTTVSYSTLVDPNILGYIPSSTATADSSAPSSIANVGGSTATATKQASGSYNGHSYAAYSTSAAVTWYQAYNAAKAMGGYLATFTNKEEWKYVETNLLTPNSIFDTNGGWIGMAKFSWFAGTALTPDPEMKWITGEQPLHDYSAGGTNAVRKSNWFGSSEPNNYNNTEGFVHFYAKNVNLSVTNSGYTSVHPWNDRAANIDIQLDSWGFIVEFQQ